MQIQPSQGPWRAQDETGCFPDIGDWSAYHSNTPSEAVGVTDANGKVIALVVATGRDYGTGQLEANARVLGAAWDMLQALEALLDGNEWATLQGIAAWHSKKIPSSEALTKARDAYIKAKGVTA